jgi:hypothetical protein
MFAVWSGTSFSAPVIAGCVAANLCVDAGRLDGPNDREARVQRARDAWKAIQDDTRYKVTRQAEDYDDDC